MKKFHYCPCVINPHDEKVYLIGSNVSKQTCSLNEFGEEGWEIVGFCTIVKGSGWSEEGNGHCSTRSDGYWLAKKEVEE